MDRKERTPDIPKQLYNQKLLPPNTETKSSFTSDNSINCNSPLMKPSNNLLSPDIQKEAADYLFQLKKQSRSMGTEHNYPILLDKNRQDPSSVNIKNNLIGYRSKPSIKIMNLMSEISLNKTQ